MKITITLLERKLLVLLYHQRRLLKIFQNFVTHWRAKNSFILKIVSTLYSSKLLIIHKLKYITRIFTGRVMSTLWLCIAIKFIAYKIVFQVWHVFWAPR